MKKKQYDENGNYRQNAAFLRGQLLKAKRQPPTLESERVFHPARNDFDVMDVVRHIEECDTHFIRPDHPDLAPDVPAGIAAAPFMAKKEITAARARYYFEDRSGTLTNAQCEVRMEALPDGLFKQTAKTQAGRGKKSDPTLHRMEESRRMLGFGFNLYALSDRLRERIAARLDGPCKPVVRMVSQRIRLSYHPDGNQDVLIEAAIEPIHFGETVTGYAWSAPKIDLEIKHGPKNHDQRRALLVTEENYLTRHFDLVREVRSSPSQGFDALFDNGLDRYGEIFDAIPARRPWRSASELSAGRQHG